jgi:hypothetical protein
VQTIFKICKLVIFTNQRQSTPGLHLCAPAVEYGTGRMTSKGLLWISCRACRREIKTHFRDNDLVIVAAAAGYQTCNNHYMPSLDKGAPHMSMQWCCGFVAVATSQTGSPDEVV